MYTLVCASPKVYNLTIHSLKYSFCSSSFMFAGRTVGSPGSTVLADSSPQRLFRFLRGCSPKQCINNRRAENTLGIRYRQIYLQYSNEHCRWVNKKKHAFKHCQNSNEQTNKQTKEIKSWRLRKRLSYSIQWLINRNKDVPKRNRHIHIQFNLDTKLTPKQSWGCSFSCFKMPL